MRIWDQMMVSSSNFQETSMYYSYRFLEMVLCGPVDECQCFGRTFCFQLLGRMCWQ